MTSPDIMTDAILARMVAILDEVVTRREGIAEARDERSERIVTRARGETRRLVTEKLLAEASVEDHVIAHNVGCTARFVRQCRKEMAAKGMI